MKHKLIAVAVAGAFAAPAVALAQSSSVQIYGTINAEYGFMGSQDLSTTTKSNRWDGLSSGASNIGFKGEEKLSGGNSAWFQCETDLGFLKGDQISANAANSTNNGWCTRNSALGLKGGMGSFFIGTWDSPSKSATGKLRYGNEAGHLSVQSFLVSNAKGNAAFKATFSARNANSINWVSPTFNGVTATVQTTSTKSAATITTAGNKGRSTGMMLDYVAGPLTAVVAYAESKDNRADTSNAAVAGIKDTALIVGGKYKIGNLDVGASYYQLKDQQSTSVETQRNSYNIGAGYKLAGPHAVWAGYSRAGDIKANKGTPTGSTGADTGGKAYILGYTNEMSKRTVAGVSYIRFKNDSNTDAYNLSGQDDALNGSSSSGIVLNLTHKF
jgi:predicted porin